MNPEIKTKKRPPQDQRRVPAPQDQRRVPAPQDQRRVPVAKRMHPPQHPTVTPRPGTGTSTPRPGTGTSTPRPDAGTRQAPQEEAQGLKEEIADLRDLSHRVSAQADEVDLHEDLIRLVEAVGKSYTRLATLLKTERLLGNGDNGMVATALNQALNEIMEEMEKKNRQKENRA